MATAIGLFTVWFVATVILAALLPKLRPYHARPPTPPLPWMPWVPQAVSASWLLVGAWFLYRWRGRAWRSPLGAMWMGLAISAALAIAATAAQLFPVIEFTQQTTRAAHDGTHELYTFSIEPYRLIEMIWPNVWGAQSGGNTYWASLIHMPGSYAKIWVPSLYLGGLVLVLALPAFAFRQGPPWQVWLSAIVVVSLLAGLGEYTSPVWLTRALAAISHSGVLKNTTASLGPVDEFDARPIREDGLLRDGDGSIYWWMATFMPGFKQFRYPAKLFTFTSLGLAVLAGLGWDRLRGGRIRGPATLAAILLGATACALLVVLIQRRPIFDSIAASQANSMFGPLDAGGAVRAIIRCLVHATLVLALGLFLIILNRLRPALAGRTLARVVDGRPGGRQRALRLHRRAVGVRDQARGPRDHRSRGTCPSLARPISRPSYAAVEPARLEHDNIARPRQRLRRLGARHAPAEVRNQPGPRIHAHDRGRRALRLRVVLRWIPPQGSRHANRRQSSASRMGRRSSTTLAEASTSGTPGISSCLPIPMAGTTSCAPRPPFSTRPEQLYPGPERFSGKDWKEEYKQWVRTKDYSIQRNEQEFPRAWVVHQARAVRPAEGLSRETRSQAIEELLYADDPFWFDDAKVAFDPRQLAWVASDDMDEIGPRLSGKSAAPIREGHGLLPVT